MGTRENAYRHLRRVARSVRHAPDRVLHGRRRRRSTMSVAGLAPVRLLFVCHGNICRSPYAAESLRLRANGAKLQIESAGFVGPGRPVPEYGQYAARRRGVDLATHRSRLVTPDLVRSSELVVVMDVSQQRALAQRFGRTDGIVVLGDFDPLPIDTRTVRDPYNQPEYVFDTVYDRIDRCLDVMFRSMIRR